MATVFMFTSLIVPRFVANKNYFLTLLPSVHIYKEYQLTSTKVPNRKVSVLQTCKKIDQGWVVAEVTHEPDQNESVYQSNCQRLPSGCLIEPLPNGLSRVSKF